MTLDFDITYSEPIYRQKDTLILYQKNGSVKACVFLP
jgi:hypothetical protein